MILGIGIDFVCVARIKALYAKHKDRTPAKMLSAAELEKFSTIKLPARRIQYIAKRFAAKEALVKALGTGFSKGSYLTDISVMNTENGRPFYLLDHKLDACVKNLFGVNRYALHLSISDDKDNALSIAILESV